MIHVSFHFSVAGFSNCYLVARESSGDAILVDPGVMNISLLKAIESNGYYIRSVFVTHSHDSHVRGLKTLKKIYDADVYAYADEIESFPCIRVSDGEAVECCGLTITPVSVSGHSADSIVYKIDRMLFTGDVLSAGRVGSTPNAYARALLVEAIQKRILGLSGDYLVFPGHGSPSTLDSERRTNPSLM